MTSIADLQLGTLTLTDVTRDDGVIEARTDIACVPHHVTLIQVIDQTDHGRLSQVTVDDPHDHFAHVQGADPGADGPLYTIEVPGHSGEWVLLISPFCR